MTARISCDNCGAREEWKINGSAPPPDQLPAHFKKRGWHIRNRATCPACSAKKEKPMAAKPQPPTNAVSAANDMDPKAVMMNTLTVTQALEDDYDASAKKYRAGKSDKALADELGLSDVFVASVREALHGKMAEPDEVTALRGEIAAVLGEIGKLQARLGDLCKRNGWAA